ncbi:hypothetical protein D3C87_1817940 [compost metagenome]
MFDNFSKAEHSPFKNYPLSVSQDSQYRQKEQYTHQVFPINIRHAEFGTCGNAFVVEVKHAAAHEDECKESPHARQVDEEIHFEKQCRNTYDKTGYDRCERRCLILRVDFGETFP